MSIESGELLLTRIRPKSYLRGFQYSRLMSCVLLSEGPLFFHFPILSSVLWSFGNLDFAFWKLELRIYDEIMTDGTGGAQWLDWLFDSEMAGS